MVKITVDHADHYQMDGDTVGECTSLVAEVQPGTLLLRVPRLRRAITAGPSAIAADPSTNGASPSPAAAPLVEDDPRSVVLPAEGTVAPNPPSTPVRLWAPSTHIEPGTSGSRCEREAQSPMRERMSAMRGARSPMRRAKGQPWRRLSQAAAAA